MHCMQGMQHQIVVVVVVSYYLFLLFVTFPPHVIHPAKSNCVFAAQRENDSL